MNIISKNKKALYVYHILQRYEAGIVLVGSEVKALREGKGNIKESYIRFLKNELFCIGMHIGDYSNAGYTSHSPTRERKMLMHRRELVKIKKSVEEKGKTLIPLLIYFKNNRVKIEFGLAQGKKNWDKRKTKMDENVKRKINREIRERQKQ